MKQSNMVITVTKSITLTAKSEITEITRTFETVGAGGKRTLVGQESSKTVKPLDFWKTVFRRAA